MFPFFDVGRRGFGELLQQRRDDRRQHEVAAPLRKLDLLLGWWRVGADGGHRPR